jgi:hypothetical protein
LCNFSGIVRCDLLEGHGAADGLHGSTGIEFGITEFVAWSILAEQASPMLDVPVLDGAPSLRLTMALVKKTPAPSSGVCLAMQRRCGTSVIN